MARSRKSLARGVQFARKRFARDQAGALAPMFAVLIIPVLTVGVFAVDLSRALTSRVALQDAVDATGLALAHLPSNTSQTELDAAATKWLTANLHDNSIGPVSVVVNSANRTVEITATSEVATLAGGLTHVLSIPLRATTTVKWGTKIELALVLDNTYSMVMNGSTKLADLKTAATNLVNTLSASAGDDPTNLKIGVVPFSITVNVGSSYKNASWITGNQPSAYGADLFTVAGYNRFTLLSNMSNTPWGGCVESRPMPYDVQDTAPSASDPGSMFVPFFSPDEEDNETWNYYGYTVNHMNRYKNNSTSGPNKDVTRYTNPAKYTGSVANSDSGFGTTVGPGYKIGPNMGCGVGGSGLQPLQRLTTDMSVVKRSINGMVATGETHIPIGLVWGWHLLSPNAPFADGSAYTAPNITKVAVLLTDGANTYFTSANGQAFNGSRYRSSYTGYGYGDQNRIGWGTNPTDADATAAMNRRLALLCTNMKNAGVVIYTVPVQVTDSTIKSLLKTCASEPNNYIEVTTSAGMASAFSDIAGSITRLRIAH